jgi:hypothetical protein
MSDPRVQIKHCEAKGVFVIRVDHFEDIEHPEVQRLARDLKAQNKKGSAFSPSGALVIILGPGVDIESIGEEEMREHGWVRANATGPHKAH